MANSSTNTWIHWVFLPMNTWNIANRTKRNNLENQIDRIDDRLFTLKNWHSETSLQQSQKPTVHSLFNWWNGFKANGWLVWTRKTGWTWVILMVNQIVSEIFEERNSIKHSTASISAMLSKWTGSSINFFSLVLPLTIVFYLISSRETVFSQNFFVSLFDNHVWRLFFSRFVYLFLSVNFYGSNGKEFPPRSTIDLTLGNWGSDETCCQVILFEDENKQRKMKSPHRTISIFFLSFFLIRKNETNLFRSFSEKWVQRKQKKSEMVQYSIAFTMRKRRCKNKLEFSLIFCFYSSEETCLNCVNKRKNSKLWHLRQDFGLSFGSMPMWIVAKKINKLKSHWKNYVNISKHLKTLKTVSVI